MSSDAMGQLLAKEGDRIVGLDVHNVTIPGVASPVPTPLPFEGFLTGELSQNVLVNGLAAATVGSTAMNVPPHQAQVVPPNALTTETPSTNQGKVAMGSKTVNINGKPAARLGDIAQTCHDIPPPTPPGAPPDQSPPPRVVVMGPGNVFVGG